VVKMLLGVMCGLCGEGRGCFGRCSSKNVCTIVEGALRDFAAGFEDDELFAGDEGEYGVGRGLGIFDEIAVDGERTAVQACEFDHVQRFLPRLSSAERRLSIGEGGFGRECEDKCRQF
jgi:hypothetical protein